MNNRYRNSIASALMVLILFSTIGFNIISTFCDGCAEEHTTIAIIEVEDDLNCECCSMEEHASCCSTTAPEQEHHKKQSTLAQLKFDSPEAKSKVFQLNTPVFLIHFVSVLLNETFTSFFTDIFTVSDLPPPLEGRQILSLICILRN